MTSSVNYESKKTYKLLASYKTVCMRNTKQPLITKTRHLCFQFIEFGHKMFVAAKEWDDPRFQRLLELSVRHIFYVYDFYSFEKEMNAHNDDLKGVFNAVAVISILDGIDIGKAMEKLAEMTGQLEREILRLEDKIKNDEKVFTKVTHDFIEKLNYCLGGNYETHLVAHNRYLRV